VTAGKVLVLGDDTRSFLATVRSLGRQAIAVHVAPANFRSPALRSRYIAAVHELPPWMGDGTEWLRAMETLLRAERFDLVIPCNETTLLPLQHRRAQLEPLARLAIPDDHAIAVLFDKFATRELARQVGVPVAAGRLVRPDDSAAGVLAEFGAPVVVKPRRSYALDSLGARGKAQVVGDSDSLARVLREVEPGETLLEQFFPGQGQGVSLVASQGRVLQAFEHHRVHERSGASFYRISAPLSPDLMRGCEAMVGGVPYTGVAMFEFKRNEQGDWILLEVNARPWGSMPLPLALGVDFPYRWYRLLVAGEEMPAVTYRTGVYGRNLLPDLMALRDEAASQRLGPIAKSRFMAGRGLELLRGVTGREVQDVLVRDDPRPGLDELWMTVAGMGQRLGRDLPGAGARRRARARAAVRRAVLQAGGRPRVVFVCQGNICRSPFAAALLAARLGAEREVRVESAGVIPQPGRPTPPFGLQAAAGLGVDLTEHRSVWLSRAMVDAASLLVGFDEATRTAVLDRYPDVRVPMVLLGDLLDGNEIADPVDGGLAAFERCYREIADGVGGLAGLMG